ncbi:hypothetical protein V8G54_011205 [Vigna mungo]|uniref:Reverse transcriptase Ty1/copia-type domain-containing protein n=1 Tax=Vigna mungo TaxID=3915 RepID=A0AAQ3S2U8_VIGMU
MIPRTGVSHNPREVYKLRKTLYGLKQVPHTWFKKFYIVIGFCSSDCNSALFIKTTSHNSIILSLYVDAIIIARGDVYEISDLKLLLAKQLEMKDLGPLCYFPVIEVA